MDTYHVIVKSTKTNELVTEFNISCKLGYFSRIHKKKANRIEIQLLQH